MKPSFAIFFARPFSAFPLVFLSQTFTWISCFPVIKKRKSVANDK